MKKILFLASLAAVAMTSCTSESNEYVGDNTPKEIAFMPLAHVPTRTIVEGVVFPDDQPIYVSAYSIPGTGTPAEYFSNATFNGTVAAGWTGSKYWPLSPVTMNFLGITGVPAGNISSFTSAGATITWTHNAADQYDLMYGVGQGTVAYGTGADINKLVYGNNVSMPFKHALAQIEFKVAVGSDSYKSNIHINKIVLNGMVTAATYTLTNSTPTTTGAQSASGVWALTTTADTDVPGSTAFASADMSTTLAANGEVVVPCKPDATTFDSFTGFTVYFTMNGSQYTYYYTPSPAEKVLSQGKKYIYNLTLSLTEIIVAPTVIDWDVDIDGDGIKAGDDDVNVAIPEV